MKMKRIKGLTLVLALVMLVALFVGCGSTGKIVSERGEEFTVDVSVKGDVKKGAPSISSNEIELAGTTYTFPIKMSELLENGWEFQGDDETELEANSKAYLSFLYLVHESGMKINLKAAVNDSSEKKNIKECTLTEVCLYTDSLATRSDYVLPGGIVPTSTAANVIKVFGNPNTTTAFSSYSCNTDNELKYEYHESSGIAYHFEFNEDGTIHSVYIAYAT